MARRTKKQLIRKFRKNRFGKDCFGGLCSGVKIADTVTDAIVKTSSKKTPFGKKVRAIGRLEHKFTKGICKGSKFENKCNVDMRSDKFVPVIDRRIKTINKQFGR